MVEQLQAMESTTPKKNEAKQNNRIKATFSLLDHAVKAYNSSETFIKRSLTLFGLGSVIAGASFSIGQNISSNQVALPQQSVDTPTHNLTSTSTPQKSLNSSSQTNPSQTNLSQPNPPQTQVIYLTPPNQSITVHNQQPTTQSSIRAHQQSELIVTNSPAPSPSSAPTPSPVNQAPKPLNTSPAINPQPIPDKQSQIKETVETVQQISGAIAGIKQDFTPLFGEQDD